MASDRHQFSVADPGMRSWAAMMALSFACHLAFFAMVHFIPGLRPERQRTLPPAVNVTMVSLPEAPTPAAAPKEPVKTPAPGIRPSPEKPQPKPTQKPDAPAPSEPKIKRSMKKKTFRSSKVVESAISRIEQKVEQRAPEQPDPLQQALERLREQVESSPPPPAAQAQKEASPATGPGLVGGASEGIRKELELIDIYRMEIAWRVQKNWAFPDSLVGNGRDLVVELAFTVLPNGEIRDVWFDKRSGNRLLDESAKRAVLKANPVGPHPKGVAMPVITVGLRFTPEGVK